MSAHLTDTTGGGLPLTGERTVPGLAVENYWFRRHEVVYRHCADMCAGRDVFEAGCGEGYGADLLAGAAHRVQALDYDAATVAHVRSRYPRVGGWVGRRHRPRTLATSRRGGPFRPFDVAQQLQLPVG